MEIDKLIRKLEPLMSERAERWHRTLDLVDPDVKGLLMVFPWFGGHF